MTIHTGPEILAALDASWSGNTIEITLGPRDQSWNPASTKHTIPGPAVVRYDRYPDGGIDARVSR